MDKSKLTINLPEGVRNALMNFDRVAAKKPDPMQTSTYGYSRRPYNPSGTTTKSYNPNYIKKPQSEFKPKSEFKPIPKPEFKPKSDVNFFESANKPTTENTIDFKPKIQKEKTPIKVKKPVKPWIISPEREDRVSRILQKRFVELGIEPYKQVDFSLPSTEKLYTYHDAGVYVGTILKPIYNEKLKDLSIINRRKLALKILLKKLGYRHKNHNEVEVFEETTGTREISSYIYFVTITSLCLSGIKRLLKENPNSIEQAQ